MGAGLAATPPGLERPATMHLRRLTLLALPLAACSSLPRAGPPSPATSARASAALTAATSAALQADGPGALAALAAVPAPEFRGADAALRTCLEGRLGEAPPAAAALGAPRAEALLAAYRTYWWRALRHPAAREEEEARLLEALRGALGAGSAATIDALEPALEARFEGAGLHALLGVTSPLRELMLWSRQDEERREVSLPDGPYAVTVVLLDGFASQGWAEWATCGRRSTGGWATEDALYAVRARYGDLSGEDFRVSLLAHETQHLADRRRFPGLAGWELEYRAKLTELALADETRPTLLASFADNQGDDPAVPHAYADRRVLGALRERLGLAPAEDLALVPGDRLRQAAAAALREDTRQRAGR